MTLTKEECETIFLKENIQLIVSKLKISQAEAAVKQAKLWPNPTLTIEEVNFWATNGQTGGEEAVPPLWGNFGRNQQFGFTFEQLILTAGKRKKLVALEQVNVEKEQLFFDELLLQLKLELRELIAELQFNQEAEKVYQQQLTYIHQLINAYDTQQKQGNIAKTEILRLKALKFELTSELHQLKNASFTLQKDLKSFLHLDPETDLTIQSTSIDKTILPTISLQELLTISRENRIDLRLLNMEKNSAEKRIQFEKAMAVPDLNFFVSYDRYGSVMKDFVGFGVAIDLPFSNRNQGNRKQAALELKAVELLQKDVEKRLENEVIAAYQNVLLAKQLLQDIDTEQEEELEQLLKIQLDNFEKRHIGMLEFIDFVDAYLTTKINLLKAYKDAIIAKEILNYTTGTEIN